MTNVEFALRDWLAGKALPETQARYAARGIPEHELRRHFGERINLNREEIIAALAYAQADAMLAAKQSQQTKGGTS